MAVGRPNGIGFAGSARYSPLTSDSRPNLTSALHDALFGPAPAVEGATGTFATTEVGDNFAASGTVTSSGGSPNVAAHGSAGSDDGNSSSITLTTQATTTVAAKPQGFRKR